MADNYLKRLKEAAWDWLEDNHRFGKRGTSRSKKDRVMGRNDKRGARQEDKKEIDKERQ